MNVLKHEFERSFKTRKLCFITMLPLILECCQKNHLGRVCTRKKHASRAVYYCNNQKMLLTVSGHKN